MTMCMFSSLCSPLHHRRVHQQLLSTVLVLLLHVTLIAPRGGVVVYAQSHDGFSFSVLPTSPSPNASSVSCSFTAPSVPHDWCRIRTSTNFTLRFVGVSLPTTIPPDGKFSGGVLDVISRRIILAPSKASEIVAVNIDNVSDVLTLGISYSSNNPYFAGVIPLSMMNGSSMHAVFVPSNVSSFINYDVRSNTMITITSTAPSLSFVGNMFSGGTIDGSGRLWFAADSAPAHFVMNSSDFSVIANLPLEGTGSDKPYFKGALYDNIDSVWMVPFNSRCVQRFNATSMAIIANYTVNPNNVAAWFCGAVVDNTGNVYFVPNDAGHVWVFNRSNASMTSLTSHSTFGNGAFQSGVFDGRRVWLVPNNYANLVALDVETLQFKEFGFPVDLLVPQNGKFWGGVFDGHYMWMIPSNAPTLVRVAIQDTMTMSVSLSEGHTTSLSHPSASPSHVVSQSGSLSITKSLSGGTMSRTGTSSNTISLSVCTSMSKSRSASPPSNSYSKSFASPSRSSTSTTTHSSTHTTTASASCSDHTDTQRMDPVAAAAAVSSTNVILSQGSSSVAVWAAVGVGGPVLSSTTLLFASMLGCQGDGGPALASAQYSISLFFDYGAVSAAYGNLLCVLVIGGVNFLAAQCLVWWWNKNKSKSAGSLIEACGAVRCPGIGIRCFQFWSPGVVYGAVLACADHYSRGGGGGDALVGTNNVAAASLGVLSIVLVTAAVVSVGYFRSRKLLVGVMPPQPQSSSGLMASWKKYSPRWFSTSHEPQENEKGLPLLANDNNLPRGRLLIDVFCTTEHHVLRYLLPCGRYEPSHISNAFSPLLGAWMPNVGSYGLLSETCLSYLVAVGSALSAVASPSSSFALTTACRIVTIMCVVYCGLLAVVFTALQCRNPLSLFRIPHVRVLKPVQHALLTALIAFRMASSVTYQDLISVLSLLQVACIVVSMVLGVVLQIAEVRMKEREEDNNILLAPCDSHPLVLIQEEDEEGGSDTGIPLTGVVLHAAELSATSYAANSFVVEEVHAVQESLPPAEVTGKPPLDDANNSFLDASATSMVPARILSHTEKTAREADDRRLRGLDLDGYFLNPEEKKQV